ncbi:MAG: hypothetical protein HN694_12840, partial [Rhodospirillaceae bacterium]|nr:hypothetical protein [Rhodospirillaceae bacterium]
MTLRRTIAIVASMTILSLTACVTGDNDTQSETTLLAPATKMMVAGYPLASVMGDVAKLRGALNSIRGKGFKPLDPPQTMKALVEAVANENGSGTGLPPMKGLAGVYGTAFVAASAKTYVQGTGLYDPNTTVDVQISGNITSLVYNANPATVILEVETVVTQLVNGMPQGSADNWYWKIRLNRNVPAYKEIRKDPDYWNLFKDQDIVFPPAMKDAINAKNIEWKMWAKGPSAITIMELKKNGANVVGPLKTIQPNDCVDLLSQNQPFVGMNKDSLG